MSKPTVIVNTGGSKDATDMDRFGRGASDLAGVQRALDKRDALNREQNDAARRGERVTRD